MSRNKIHSLLALFGLLAICLFSFSGCGLLCGTPEERTIEVSPATRAFVPYQGNEILRFRNNNGVVITYRDTLSTFVEEVDGCECGCCAENIVGEVLNFSFSPDTLGFPIYIQLWPKDFGDEFVIDLKNSRRNISMSEFVCSEERGYQPCIGQMTVNGASYQHVFDIGFNQFDDSGNAFVGHVFYTPDAGIIKFTMPGGEEWELVP